ncbi:MAG: ferritin-like domain-containing protein [Actinobacteria bacterium]|nr:ferritin-like domain-containing protein [Actinomycetota bacterium]
MVHQAADLNYQARVARGQLDLGWLSGSGAEWGVRATPSRVGLTLRDIAVGSYGDLPDHPPRRTMAPRGSDVPDDVPDMGYTVNDLSAVWSDNVMELYEEAVSRQWSATRDIPWSELKPIDLDLEHAMCQLATVLSEVEMVASDFPAKWLWRINHDFVEAKMFLCTQVMDEARHTEVFRKRALANGGGMGRASAVVEQFLKLILDAESYDEGSALMHLLGEGLVLSLFRAGEMIAPSPVEKRIFRLCMQDEARHVSYGTMHLRYRLQRDPLLAADFHAYLDRGEELISALFTTPEVVEPATILAAGSVAAAAELGTAASDVLRIQSIEEYLQRCERAGLDRRGRMHLPDVILAGTSGATARSDAGAGSALGALS